MRANPGTRVRLFPLPTFSWLSIRFTLILPLLAVASAADNIQVFFSPHGGCTEAVVKNLGRATTSILVQAYSFTSTPIAKALADANTSANHLIAALKASGIATDDITTSGPQVYPNYTGNQIISGYQASSQVSVTVRNIDQAGPVIDAAAAAAGDHITIGGVSFTISDPEKVIGAARSAAIDNAKARAGQYATAAGGTVGQVLQISEVSVSPMPVYDSTGTTAAAQGKDAYNPILSGTQDLTVSVAVIYALT